MQRIPFPWRFHTRCLLGTCQGIGFDRALPCRPLHVPCALTFPHRIAPRYMSEYRCSSLNSPHKCLHLVHTSYNWFFFHICKKQFCKKPYSQKMPQTPKFSVLPAKFVKLGGFFATFARSNLAFCGTCVHMVVLSVLNTSMVVAEGWVAWLWRYLAPKWPKWAGWGYACLRMP